MAKTRAQQNRAIRQEALRDQLANQGHLQHIVEIAQELGKPEIESKDITRLKAKADIHLALMKKYIPDLKAMELSGDQDNPILVDSLFTVEVVGAETPDT